MNPDILTAKYNDLKQKLVGDLNDKGFWTGRLSTSALSTAVAIVALKTAGDKNDNDRIENGFRWILNKINPDGGYGDTTGSVSNVSTTLLCYAAVSFCHKDKSGVSSLVSMERWLEGKGIAINPDTITRSVLKFYGKDYTFSIPILSMLNLCGVIPDSALRKIPMLPFELTLLPASFYRFFNLRVVSYALPALIGVGIYIHRKRSGQRLSFRNKFVKPAIKKLDDLLPESGGFLEAIPLTGFVAMCLHASGEIQNITVKKGIQFLRNTQRNDGGWPIDTDLSSWVTTLSIKALGSDIVNLLTEQQLSLLRSHLLKLQYKSVHPFNNAGPGGWGWTSFTGSVPDADDTPGAILALLQLYTGKNEEREAILNGCKWLIRLQNNDGGFPTFCRGWGRLPFDSSCADLTGHAVCALVKTTEKLGGNIDRDTKAGLNKCLEKAVGYLEKKQSTDGSWLPLWFGNQNTKEQTNPVYGTSKVCTYLNDCVSARCPGEVYKDRITLMIESAREYLLLQQNSDGSWGGEKGIRGTIEETSLAICALSGHERDACLEGFEWLAKQTDLKPAPIGLYFALLWYDEKLYPVIYYTEALRRFLGAHFDSAQ
ncbi:MAG TPA: prenyltransferase/squalene oxidase repeat-containing protein [Bacteroidales bacterium]|nr:prenyltransferase/squalene oxidase repeat-containing protein [Bacteroidales bacterium]